MPAYEYACVRDTCDHSELVWLNMSDEHPDVLPCPGCDVGTMKRVWQAVNVGKVTGCGDSPARFSK